MTERESLNDVSSEREAYSAPNYERYMFETSGLMQSSGAPGSVGNATLDHPTVIAAGLVDSDW